MDQLLLFISLCIQFIELVECENIAYIPDSGFTNGNGQPTIATLLPARSNIECAVWSEQADGFKSFTFDTSGQKCYGLSFPQAGQSSSTLPGTPRYYVSNKACSQRYDLVTGSSGIANSQFYASSYVAHTPPYLARIDNTNHWAPEGNDQNPYIMLDFRSIKTIEAIVTQGKYGQWDGLVTSYMLYYSLDCSSYVSVKHSNGVTMIFPGNIDQTSHKTNYISPGILARCIKLYPIIEYIAVGLRMEVKGC